MANILFPLSYSIRNERTAAVDIVEYEIILAPKTIPLILEDLFSARQNQCQMLFAIIDLIL